jgi:anti-sigma factor (TIGR02949 family)
LLTCKEFLAWLNEYLDEDAAEDIRKKVEQHVNACPNCWVIFDTTKKTLKIYKGMEPQELPKDVESRLMAALEKRLAREQ